MPLYNAVVVPNNADSNSRVNWEGETVCGECCDEWWLQSSCFVRELCVVCGLRCVLVGGFCFGRFFCLRHHGVGVDVSRNCVGLFVVVVRGVAFLQKEPYLTVNGLQQKKGAKAMVPKPCEKYIKRYLPNVEVWYRAQSEK